MTAGDREKSRYIFISLRLREAFVEFMFGEHFGCLFDGAYENLCGRNTDSGCLFRSREFQLVYYLS